MNNKSIENLISEFTSKLGTETPEPCYEQINVRLPESYKHKYDEIQARHKKMLSKLLTKLTMQVIDSVEV